MVASSSATVHQTSPVPSQIFDRHHQHPQPLHQPPEPAGPGQDRQGLPGSNRTGPEVTTVYQVRAVDVKPPSLVLLWIIVFSCIHLKSDNGHVVIPRQQSCYICTFPLFCSTASCALPDGVGGHVFLQISVPNVLDQL